MGLVLSLLDTKGSKLNQCLISDFDDPDELKGRRRLVEAGGRDDHSSPEQTPDRCSASRSFCQEEARVGSLSSVAIRIIQHVSSLLRSHLVS